MQFSRFWIRGRESTGMSGATDLRSRAVNTSRMGCRGEYSRCVSSYVMKRSDLYVTKVASTVKQLAGLSRREPCHVRGGLDVVESEAHVVRRVRTPSFRFGR